MDLIQMFDAVIHSRSISMSLSAEAVLKGLLHSDHQTSLAVGNHNRGEDLAANVGKAAANFITEKLTHR